jgi:hypothetical protein
MGRPSSPNTRIFHRPITPEQREILLDAGNGDLTIGFNECLELWRSIHPLNRRFAANVSRETPARASKAKTPGKAPSPSPDPMQNLHNPMHPPHEG